MITAMSNIIKGITVAGALLFSATSFATILDFNDINNGGQTGLGGSYTYNGFTFTHPETNFYAISSFDNDVWNMNGDGTDHFGWRSHGGDLTMTEANGGTFSLSSLEIGQLIYNGNGGTATITGNLLGGGTLVESVTVAQNFTSVSLSNWNNLTSVVFSGPVSWMTMDNINTGISAVPAPATLALMGLGLVGLGLRRKRTH